MRFTNPLALILLLLLPAVAALGWPVRGFSRRKEIISLTIRLVIVLCVVLSLAGLETVRTADELAVVFLIDASDSMPLSSQNQAIETVRQAMSGMKAGDQAAVVVFGGDALVERLMSANHQLGEITSIPRSDQTDLSAAIRLALALYPPDAARRMVLLSDGEATRGDVDAAARLAAASGVQIMVLPFGSPGGPEALVRSVNVPPNLRLGEQFDLQLQVQANQVMNADLRVLAGGQLIYQGSRELRKGEQTFSLPLKTGGAGFNQTGFVRFEVQIAPQNDHFYQNNEMEAFTQIEGPAKVLVVAPPVGENLPFNQEPRPDESGQLIKAFEATNFELQVVPPSGLPSDLTELAPYESVVLVDVPASELSDRQMLALQSYVRDLGGGLLAIGGPTSYGVGGYYRTPLEETLPLEMQIKDEQRRPTLTMVFIIDRSGSMSETSGGVSKIELAKEAAIRSTEMLFPGDRVGVIAFDESASWVVPPTTLSDPGSVIRAIGSIRSGGGTDILAGLQLMAKTLPGDPGSLKHVILLTDGGADPTGIPQLVEQLYQQSGITLSTVGVGQDAAAFLPDLARLAGGRYHFAADPGTIPRIFSEETTLAARSYIIERTFTPLQTSASPILTGIQALPPLHGFVGTTAKATAQTILVSDQNEPILAAWRYGLGKAVAFTSDASARWARDWINWPGYPQFWAQALNYTTGGKSGAPLDVQVEDLSENSAGGQNTALLVVNAQTENGAFLNDYEMQANLVSPDGNSSTLTLAQVAPGRYQSPFNPEQQGTYLLHISGNPDVLKDSQSGDSQISSTSGWVHSYSSEYRDFEPDPKLLAQIAATTGGKVLGTQSGDIFKHDLPAGRASRPIWPGLLMLSAILLPLDIALRRLVISPNEIRTGLESVLRRLKPDQGIQVPQRTTRMSALLQAKERAAGEGEPAATRPSYEEPAKRTGDNPSEKKYPPSPAPEIRPQKPEPAQQKTTSPQQDDRSPASGSTAASLLATKRKKQGRD